MSQPDPITVRLPTLQPTSQFRCAKYSCSMAAGTCEKRQLARRSRGNHKDVPVYEYCGSHRCEQGRQIRAQLGAWDYQPRDAPRPTTVEVPRAQIAWRPAAPLPAPAPPLTITEAELEELLLDVIPPTSLSLTAHQVLLEQRVTLDLARARLRLGEAWGLAVRRRPIRAVEQLDLEALAATAEPVIPAAAARAIQQQLAQVLSAANEFVAALRAVSAQR